MISVSMSDKFTVSYLQIKMFDFSSAEFYGKNGSVYLYRTYTPGWSASYVKKERTKKCFIPSGFLADCHSMSKFLYLLLLPRVVSDEVFDVWMTLPNDEEKILKLFDQNFQYLFMLKAVDNEEVFDRLLFVCLQLMIVSDGGEDKKIGTCILYISFYL